MASSLKHLITFEYKNHRGEIAKRTIDFIGVQFNHKVGFGYQPGWFLYGICQTKMQPRSFALCNIHLPKGDMHYLLEPMVAPEFKMPAEPTDSELLLVFGHPETGERTETTIVNLIESGIPICTRTEQEYDYIGARKPDSLATDEELVQATLDLVAQMQTKFLYATTSLSADVILAAEQDIRSIGISDVIATLEKISDTNIE